MVSEWKILILLPGHPFNIKGNPKARSFVGHIVSVSLSIGKWQVGLRLESTFVVLIILLLHH